MWIVGNPSEQGLTFYLLDCVNSEYFKDIFKPSTWTVSQCLTPALSVVGKYICSAISRTVGGNEYLKDLTTKKVSSFCKAGPNLLPQVNVVSSIKFVYSSQMLT